jgi:hypothetical protein
MKGFDTNSTVPYLEPLNSIHSLTAFAKNFYDFTLVFSLPSNSCPSRDLPEFCVPCFPYLNCMFS